MTRRKPGTFRAGDIVQWKGSTHLRKVDSVYWTEKGDAVMLSTLTSPQGLFPAKMFEVILPREQRICGVCDLPVFGPAHLNSSCPVR